MANERWAPWKTLHLARDAGGGREAIVIGFKPEPGRWFHVATIYLPLARCPLTAELEEYARRIVASVNACAGISLEEMEHYGVGGIAARLRSLGQRVGEEEGPPAAKVEKRQ